MAELVAKHGLEGEAAADMLDLASKATRQLKKAEKALPYQRVVEAKKSINPTFPGSGICKLSYRVSDLISYLSTQLSLCSDACPNADRGCKSTNKRKSKMLVEHLLAGKCVVDPHKDRRPADLVAYNEFGKSVVFCRLLLTPLFFS